MATKGILVNIPAKDYFEMVFKHYGDMDLVTLVYLINTLQRVKDVRMKKTTYLNVLETLKGVNYQIEVIHNG